MRKQAIKGKELLVLSIVLLVFIILLAATGLFFRGKNNTDDKAEKGPTVVEGTISAETTAGNGKPEEESQLVGSDAFFLKPSANDVLAALRESDQQLQKPPENLPAMNVMWPGYFFSLDETAPDETVIQLDVDESGFGIVLHCQVNITDYPEIRTLQKGQKVWVAGKISQVDLEGTGTVFIDVKYMRFDDGPVKAGAITTD